MVLYFRGGFIFYSPVLSGVHRTTRKWPRQGVGKRWFPQVFGEFPGHLDGRLVRRGVWGYLILTRKMMRLLAPSGCSSLAFITKAAKSYLVTRFTVYSAFAFIPQSRENCF